jgi:hypothetical protein
VPALVEGSDAGLFQRDLQARLQVRVHDTLLDLVLARRLARETFGGEYLYVSADSARAKAQIAQRHEGGPGGVSTLAPPPPMVIEILLEAIHAGRLRGDPAAISARLAGRGVAVPVEQVREVFRQLGIPEKKTRYPSKHSRK